MNILEAQLGSFHNPRAMAALTNPKWRLGANCPFWIASKNALGERERGSTPSSGG